MSTSLRILLIDDHTIFRAGLRMLLESHREMTVVGEASTSQEALTLAADLHPDLCLLDLDLGEPICLEIIPNLLTAARGTQILVMTGVRDSELYREALELGARGIVLKDLAIEGLFDAVLTVSQGRLWIDQSTWMETFSRRHHESSDAAAEEAEAAKLASLTKREREIIALLSDGLRNQQIADRLLVSEGTIRNHLTVIFEKLNLSGRFELVVYALKHRLNTSSSAFAKKM